jgi:hypothetical protein
MSKLSSARKSFFKMQWAAMKAVAGRLGMNAETLESAARLLGTAASVHRRVGIEQFPDPSVAEPPATTTAENADGVTQSPVASKGSGVVSRNHRAMTSGAQGKDIQDLRGPRR